MNLMRKLTVGNDARSNQGMFARGKAIYRDSSHASKAGPTGPQKAAIGRRLQQGKPKSRGYFN